ncbi:MAG: A24 family peptidase [Gammaproteobacteria bacterium]|nr:A24 family peptidase [Rhodospirillaceae bacterium]MDE0364507.1 A24 family peptidase [Gammaproteobacteria bacterium]
MANASYCCQDSGFKLVSPDLVPLLPWIIGRGRCRHCGATIPFVVPVLELVMIAAVIVTAVLVRDDAQAVAGCFLGWLLVLLVVADLRRQVLPDSLTATLLASGLLAALFLPTPGFTQALIGAAIGGGSFFVLRFLYFRYRGIEGLGLGDVKLMAGLGAWLGPAWLPPLVLIAAVAGLIVVMLQSWSQGTTVSATSRVAFGAYLGGTALLLWGLMSTGAWEW